MSLQTIEPIKTDCERSRRSALVTVARLLLAGLLVVVIVVAAIRPLRNLPAEREGLGARRFPRVPLQPASGRRAGQ